MGFDSDKLTDWASEPSPCQKCSDENRFTRLMNAD